MELILPEKNQLHKTHGRRPALRNKERNFPNLNEPKLEGEPRAKAEYASKRADGTINTRPQERMRASGKRSHQ